MYEVHNGRQRLSFDGALLAESTSRRRNSPRWVEFQLFRTIGGVYVLSRVGRSSVFHTPSCEVLERSDSLDPARVDENAVPCDVCRPHRTDAITVPEKQRHWGQVMETPEAILDSLYRYDDHGARYMTRVARELIETAAEKDAQLADAYYVEHVK